LEEFGEQTFQSSENPLNRKFIFITWHNRLLLADKVFFK
jgi:hypothetical protein